MYKIDEYLIRVIANALRIDVSKYDMDDLIIGMQIELEHGTISPLTNVTNDDMFMTFKIMYAHILEYKDYYKGLVLLREILKNDKLDALISLANEK